MVVSLVDLCGRRSSNLSFHLLPCSPCVPPDPRKNKRHTKASPGTEALECPARRELPELNRIPCLRQGRQRFVIGKEDVGTKTRHPSAVLSRGRIQHGRLLLKRHQLEAAAATEPTAQAVVRGGIRVGDGNSHFAAIRREEHHLRIVRSR